jgi:hypothetical protein
MSIDTAEKRFSTIEMRIPWARRILPIADGSDWDGAQRYFGLSLYSGLAADAPPAFAPAGVFGGTAFDTNGRMGTLFLEEAEAVPSSAVFRNGYAHAPDGRRYIALWPVSGEVYFDDGIAAREDGAMCVVTTGTPRNWVDGVALSDRGEVIVSTSPAQFMRAGKGCRSNGALCVSESS